jgi:hypothetical protein
VPDRQSEHPLKTSLTDTEGQLQDALEDVCEDTEIPKRNTDELIRIDETLAIASEAAKQAVSLRKRIHADEEQSPPLA